MSALEAVRLFDGEALWSRGMKGVLSLVILMLLTVLICGALKTFWSFDY